jgi:predicted lipoprotein with Yx(FWY)xxD motif
MRHLQKEKGKKATTATISITIIAIAIMVASTTMAMSTIATPVQATTTTTVSSSTTTTSNNNATTASASSSSSEVKLSPLPIYEERSPPGNLTTINETHGILTFTGSGMLTLPNTTQTINTTSNGTAIISFATSSGYAKETIRTENGETVTATAYEIVHFNNPAAAPEGGGKGIVTSVFQTNSTGMLAPLNGVIAVGIDEMSPSGESHVTLWRWENGGSSSSSNNNTTNSSNDLTGTTTPSSPSSTTQGGSLY